MKYIKLYENYITDVQDKMLLKKKKESELETVEQELKEYCKEARKLITKFFNAYQDENFEIVFDPPIKYESVVTENWECELTGLRWNQKSERLDIRLFDKDDGHQAYGLYFTLEEDYFASILQYIDDNYPEFFEGEATGFFNLK